MKRLKDILRLTRVKRIMIMAITAIASILTIVLGTVYYTAPNSQLGVEYAGGYEYVVEVKPQRSDVDSNEIATTVAQEIYERVDYTGTKGITVEAETRDDANAYIRVQVPNLDSEAESNYYKTLISEKPALTITDLNGNPIFNQQGSYDTNVVNGLNNFIYGDVQTFDYSTQSITPIESGGASAQVNATSGQHEIVVSLKDDLAIGWYLATTEFTGSSLAMWINLEGFIDIAENEFPSEWANAGHNPYNFAYVNETPVNEDLPNGSNSLKEYQLNAKNYLISVASVSSGIMGTEFTISGNFNGTEAHTLARSINYGSSGYSLDIVTQNQISSSYGESSFDKTLIAGIIVISLIAIFLVWTYGLLGLISSLSIGLFVAFTLMAFTLMGGSYSPESVAALIIGVGMSVDANIIMFERFKTNFYNGSSLKKSIRSANKKSFITILDSNITTAIVAFVLFFFGTRSIIGLSITLILSIIFTMIIMLGITRMLTTMLIKSEIANKKPGLFGLRKNFDTKIDTKINSINYTKNSKWFVRASLLIIGVGALVMTILSSIGGSFGDSFNLSRDFRGGTVISVSSERNSGFSSAEVNDIETYFTNAGVVDSDVDEIYTDSVLTGYKVEIDYDIEISEINKIEGRNVSTYVSNTTTAVAKQLVKDALISIGVAFGLVILYTLIRFRWTFSIAAILALLHDVAITTSIFIFTRVEVSPVFVAAILSIVGYSINDTIVTFDRIREKLSDTVGVLDKKKIVSVANEAIRDTLKRSLITSATTIMAILVLLAFGNATKFTFNFAMLIGLLSGTYSSIFIATIVWVKLETWRSKMAAKRAKSGFWNSTQPDEETIVGINDYSI